MRTAVLTALMCFLAGEAYGQAFYSAHWLPPAKYDKEYDGRVIVDRITAAQMKIYCPGTQVETVLACSGHKYGICVVHMLTDQELVDRGYRYDLVLRHEVGHCNGWTSAHEDAVILNTR